MGNEPQRMMDGYGTDEMTIPIWKLVQSVGGEYAKTIGAHPGNFYCELTQEITEELEIIVVDIRKNRTYWGRTEIEDQPPECGSLDGLTSMDGLECATCEHKTDTPWLLSAADRRNMCTVSYNILAINFADSLPILIRASGISAMPVRQLLTQLRLNKTLKGEYHRAIITVTSAPKKTPAGEAYSLHFKGKGLVEDQGQIEEFKQESLSLLGAPMMLPEGRDEDEPEPLGYTPKGTAFYSEEERDKLMAEEEKQDEPPPAPAEAPIEKEKQSKVPPVTPAKGKTPQETKEEPIKLDF